MYLNNEFYLKIEAKKMNEIDSRIEAIKNLKAFEND